MIRILHVVTKMDRGGLESRLMDIYRNIDRTKIQFDFYTFSKKRIYSGFDDEIISLGGKIFYNDPLNIHNYAEIPHNFMYFCTSHPEYQIVHCHVNSWCGLVLLGAKRAGIPVRIAHSRAATKGLSVKILIKNIIKLPVNRNATHRFAVSREAGEWLFGRKALRMGHLQIWPNATDCNKYKFNTYIREKMRKELNIMNNIVIVHVGNITPVKNHVFLIDIFAELKKHVPNAKLILVGEDNLNGKIQRYSSVKKIEKDIIFLGVRDDVQDILQAGDVFVFPSIYEGFPGAVLEAQASGLPCIISDTITKEACILTSTKQVSLQKSASDWAQIILNSKNAERDNAYKVLKLAGYDVLELASRLTDFYERVIL